MAHAEQSESPEADTVRSLALMSELPVGHETTLQYGRILSLYVGDGGDPLQTLVLVAPDENYPVTRGIFHQQTLVLDQVHDKDRLDMSRRILSQELWSQGPAGFCNGLVFVRVTEGTVKVKQAARPPTLVAYIQQTRVDLSFRQIENFHPFDNEIYKIPAVTGQIESLARGALVICNVTPFRIDLPIPNTPVTQAVFSRAYGLNAVDTVRIFKSQGTPTLTDKV
ncbi:hypothetical protein B0H11DRAFT_1919800 [Mycena galericulata]|nr:hypothetical protein B0H11DRAFT_1919800 [Mycena galericulata]